MAPETATLIGTLAGTFLGSFLGIIGTWLTLKSQYRIKALELSGQARLHAKELLFKAYQDRITQINKRSGDLQAMLGTFLGVYQALDNENDRKQINEAMFTVFQQVYEFRREWFEELKEERRKVGLENSSPVQMAAIETSLRMDVSNITSQEQAKEMIVNIARMIAASDNLWQDVLVRKSEILFEEEIDALSETT
jgi:hypothetical protein